MVCQVKGSTPSPCAHQIRINMLSEQERLMLLQGTIDRILYLSEKDREEFLKYIQTLYTMYPIPKKIKYGVEAFNHD